MIDALRQLEQRKSQSAVALTVHESWASVDGIVDEWDGLALRVGGCVYLTAGYARAWWDVYGRGQLTILEFRRDGRLVGVLPFLIWTTWRLGAPVRMARLLSTDSTISVVVPAVDPLEQREVWSLALSELDRRGAEVVVLSPLGCGTESAEAIDAAAEAARMRRILDDRSAVFAMYRLGPAISSHIDALDKKSRADLRRAQRALGPNGTLTLDVVPGNALDAAMRRFIALHEAGWRADGGLGQFGDWPRSVEFLDALLANPRMRERFLVFEIRHEGQLVGGEWAFVFGRRGFDRLPARARGEELDALGIGRVIQYALFEQMIDRGVAEVESGPGHYPYKLRGGAVELPIFKKVFAASGGIAGLKASMWCVYGRLLHYGYYRGLRARVQPRLRLRSGPLWTSWIQTRL